ncbi:hypothetical protein BET03_03165 [Thermohalobacter berrensis]|uniref:Uncharacterized protein n=1 Tax=Thermohalobacter berrensis TaxID=99594 RepID=A0A419T483_9FIRM|nr:hypothetical protein BET03_03165 [Thermohalobacter berrensis]
MEKLLDEGIMAIVPVYINMKGNVTKIITREKNEFQTNRSIKTFLRILASFYGVDLRVSRKYYGKLIGAKNIVPFYFDRDNILVPVKVRKPISKNDGAFGYINLKYIREVKEKKKTVNIILEGNISIKCLQSYRTVIKHIRDAKILKRVCSYNEPLVMEERANFYKEYNKPATKGDIAVLRNEILDIKNTLKSN